MQVLHAKRSCPHPMQADDDNFARAESSEGEWNPWSKPLVINAKLSLPLGPPSAEQSEEEEGSTVSHDSVYEFFEPQHQAEVRVYASHKARV